MKRLVIGAVLIAMLAIATGTGCQAIRYQQIRNSVQPHGVEVTGAEVRWTLLIPTGVTLSLDAIIWNGSDYPLEIERARYTVYIGEREVGEDTIYDVHLPPTALTYIPVSLNLSIADLGQWVWEYLTEGVEIRVAGTAEIPVRIWGFRVASVPVGFDESVYYRLSQP